MISFAPKKMKKEEIRILINNEGSPAIFFHIYEGPAEVFSSYGWSESKESAVEDAKEFLRKFSHHKRGICDYSGSWGFVTIFNNEVCSKFWKNKEEMEAFMKRFEMRASSVNLNTIKVEYDLYIGEE